MTTSSFHGDVALHVALPANDDHSETKIYSHSIINKPSKPAWLKDLAVIDMGLYRHFYRQNRTSFAGAGDGAICGASTLSTSLSINSNHTLQAFALQHGMLPT